MGVRIEANYLLAVYIIVPLSLLLLLAALLYICCNRRYRLNWFERSILEEHDVEKERLYVRSPRPSITVTTARRGSSRLGWARPLGSMLGSTSGSPSPESGEKFWVPPAVLQRKRAQSLVPALLHHGDSCEEEVQSSGAVTPSSMTGLRELMFTFPAEKFGGSLGAGMDLPPSPAPSPVPPPQLQKRRASMHDAIDHTKIDAKLYSKIQSFRQQSVCSIQEENLGAINFSLDYNKETSLLTVRLIQARDLVPRDLSGTVDPYCKVCLQPFDKIQLQSKIHKETLHPEFEEEFIFEVSNADLPTSVLEILIFHFDQYSQDECIGQVHFSLDYVDLSERVVLWKGISAYEDQKTKETADLGNLMFSLSYLSSAERLTVIVAKARNLRHTEEGRVTMDPYVKVALMYAGKKLKKKKTSIKHNTANPVWNEALVFGLGREFLKNVYLEFTVLHDNKIGTDELLGRLKIGADSATDELAHWNEMVSGKNTVARWFSLQS